MNRFSLGIGRLAIAACATTLIAATGGPSAAQQCATCATPTIAFAPVVPAAAPVAFAPVAVAAPTVTVQRTGWYPGRMIDSWRIRRWFGTPTVVTTAFAPTATAVVPTTVGFAPTTVGFAPTTDAFAVTTANFAPVTANFAPPTTAAPFVTAYAPLQNAWGTSLATTVPTTVLRPISVAPVTAMQPVVTESLSPVINESGCSACSTGCSACSVAAPCSTCSATTAAYDPGATQAVYTESAAPAAGCSSCAAGAGTPSYPASTATPEVTYPAPSSSSTDPITPQPSLIDPPVTSGSSYRSNLPSATPASDITPAPAADDGKGSSTLLEPPQLLDPSGSDRTARKPTVDVWTAVYRGPASATGAKTSVSTASARKPTQAELDARGWESAR